MSSTLITCITFSCLLLGVAVGDIYAQDAHSPVKAIYGFWGRHEVFAGKAPRSIKHLTRRRTGMLFKNFTLGVPMVEIARHVGAGTSAIAMAIRREVGE